MDPLIFGILFLFGIAIGSFLNVVASRYDGEHFLLDNKVIGVLGIIGPTRMAYERVIPIVDVTAKLLGSALNTRK